MQLELVTLKQAKSEHKAVMGAAKMFLVFNGQKIPFETANEASGMISELREQSGMGARELGSMFAIVDRTGKEIGYVSYNGRVWEGTRKNWQQAKCVFPLECEPCQTMGEKCAS